MTWNTCSKIIAGGAMALAVGFVVADALVPIPDAAITLALFIAMAVLAVEEVLPEVTFPSESRGKARIAETPDYDPREPGPHAAQVRERYVAGEINETEMEERLEAALED